MTRAWWHPGVLLIAGAGLVAGCEPVATVPPVQPAPPRPETAQPSEESRKIAAHFERVQASLLSQGLLRMDGGGPDVPFNARTLTRNFLRIALYQEYQEAGGHLVAGQNASFLHRWEIPIRYQVSFGASVPEGQRRTDGDQIEKFTGRVAGLTGLSIQESAWNTNFHVFVVNEDERRALGPVLRRIEPGISAATLDAVVNMPRDIYCLAFASDPNEDGTYARAVVVIRSEHPDLMRVSCIHEEIAQSLGLANDSPQARPSIFNDDEEFGLLTTHDEMLLRILYDRRLRPGMTEDEARPIVEIIAAELMGGEV